MTPPPPADLLRWLDHRRSENGLRVEHISWDQCTPHWRFEKGALKHVSGGFFSIVGLSAHSNVAALDGLATPIIDQPEIGILAFLLRKRGEGFEWLLQAKTEPGNVGETQFAPSVQATESNFSRLHGGEATAFLDLVQDEGAGRPGRMADVRQSEQGGMFRNKYNRNVAQLIDGERALQEQWRWAPSSDVRGLCLRDFTLNTDARSVLSSAPWRLLSRTGAPFEPQDEWSALLSASYAHTTGDSAANALEIERGRIWLDTDIVPLETLPACVNSANEIRSDVRVPALIVRPYAVAAHDREVKAWRQPLVLRDREEDAWLVCAIRGGVLRFFFRFSAEIGFRDHKVQLGPSAQTDAFAPPAPWIGAALRHSAAVTCAQIRQSDEGGRFMRCITRYRLAQVPEQSARDAHGEGVWITLGDMEKLAAQRGVFTNEARSLISMLLAWA